MPTKKTVKKPMYEKFKFWLPIVTGLVTSASFAVKYALDIAIPETVVAWIIVGTMTVLGAIIGVEWSQIDDLQ